jgi:hypothetical protein
MLIGTSLGQCLKDILSGQVSESDVVMIITRTMAEDAEKLMVVVDHYYYSGNGNHNSYDLSVGDTKTIEEVRELASRLFNTGKIHQPRCFPNFRGGYVHPDMVGAGTWIELAPKTWNTTPAVVEAYDKYKMLDALTK